MILEQQVFGNIFIVDQPADFISKSKVVPTATGSGTRPTVTTTTGCPGWNELKARRVFNKLIQSRDLMINMLDLNTSISISNGTNKTTNSTTGKNKNENSSSFTNINPLFAHFKLINFTHNEKEIQQALITEESLMQKEVDTFGAVLVIESNGLNVSTVGMSQDLDNDDDDEGMALGELVTLIKRTPKQEAEYHSTSDKNMNLGSKVNMSSSVARHWHRLKACRMRAKESVVLTASTSKRQLRTSKHPLADYKTHMDDATREKREEEEHRQMVRELSQYGATLQLSSSHRSLNTTCSYLFTATALIDASTSGTASTAMINKYLSNSTWLPTQLTRIQTRAENKLILVELKQICDAYQKKHPHLFPARETAAEGSETGKLSKEEQVMIDETKTYGSPLYTINNCLEGDDFDLLLALDRDQSSFTQQINAGKQRNSMFTIPNIRKPGQKINKYGSLEHPSIALENSVNDIYNQQGGPIELVFTKDNFDPKDLTKRPPGWHALRMKRIIIKEQLDRAAGIDEDVIGSQRPVKEIDEENIMLSEVSKYGKLLTTETNTNKRNSQPLVTADGDEEDEDDEENEDEEGDGEGRENETATAAGVTTGTTATATATGVAVDSTGKVITPKKKDTGTGRKSKLSANQQPNQPTVMKKIIANKSNYLSYDLSKRPHGWFELQLKRVMLKEHMDRIAGIAELVIDDMHAERMVEEEMLMIDEVTSFKNVIMLGENRPVIEVSKYKLAAPASGFKNATPAPTAAAGATEAMSGGVVSPGAPVPVVTAGEFSSLSRPMGWKELLKTRVLIKEMFDKAQGIPEKSVIEKRYKREIDVSSSYRHSHNNDISA